jgi:hypothetical protein
LTVLSAADAEGLAQICIGFQGAQNEKGDEVGLRFWYEMTKRLRAFAEARGKMEERHEQTDT